MSVMLRCCMFICHAEGAACLSCAGAALLSWEPYAAVAAVASCLPLPGCADFTASVITCSATGRVTEVYAPQHEPPPAGSLPAALALCGGSPQRHQLLLSPRMHACRKGSGIMSITRLPSITRVICKVDMHCPMHIVSAHVCMVNECATSCFQE
jgi:hypothetical protein